jgi:nitrate/TMAO reductase-like tetraheme cytochrome c subunit
VREELTIMAARLGISLATFFVLGFAVAAGAGPQAVKPPGNDDCLACHGDADAKRASGTSIAVDQKIFAGSAHGPLDCVDCHKDLATLQEFPHPDTLAKVACASCHDAEGAKYRDSIHSWARDKAGLTAAAPACADCHGKHDIRGTKDREARVYRANIPETCGSCHQGVLARYDQGVHAVARRAGNDQAAVCADCHTAHGIQRADTGAARLSVTAECGTCHAESLRTYRDTFHGQMTRLEFVRVATCADCHGAHDIFPQADARSTVHVANRVATCQKCHQQANASFARYDPHADRRDRARNPALYVAGRFMDGLLLTVFTAFGLHTALWLGRGLKQRRRPKTDPGAASVSRGPLE